jgi:hypothetical protein
MYHDHARRNTTSMVMQKEQKSTFPDYIDQEVVTKGEDISIGVLCKSWDTYQNYGPSQRGYVWTLADQQWLMDTIIRRLPLQGILAMNDTDYQGRLILQIADGQQRLTTIRKYLDGEFALMDEQQAKASMMTLPLIQPGKYFRQLPMPLQNRILGRTIHFEIFDKTSEDSLATAIERANRQRQFTVPEKLWIHNCLTKTRAVELMKHPMWEHLYEGSTIHREIYQAVINTIILEIHQGLPVNLRNQGHSAPIHKLIAGEWDGELTETFVSTIWQYYSIIEHLFGASEGAESYDGIYMTSKSDSIPVSQAVKYVEAKGYDLLGSQKGCLKTWFNQTKRGIITDNLVHRHTNAGRMDFLEEQKQFWSVYADTLLKSDGLVLR